MALRTLMSDGVEWTVWDVVPSSAARLRITGAQALAAGWLVFDSGAEKRRLPNIPADWEGWSDAELDQALRAASRDARPARQSSAPPMELLAE